MDDLDKTAPPIRCERLLRPWIDLFGAENVDVVLFDRGNFPDGDLIHDYCNRIAVRHEDRFRVGLSNVTPSYSEICALRCLNALGVRSWRTRRRLAKALAPMMPRKTMPTEWDAAILSTVREENRRLNRTHLRGCKVKLPE